MGMIESNYCILTFGIYFRNNNFEGKNSQQRKICLLFKNVSNVLICLWAPKKIFFPVLQIFCYLFVSLFFLFTGCGFFARYE